MRTTAECWKEVIRPALLQYGFRCAAKTGVLRADSGEVALEVRYVGSRFNGPTGYGVPHGYSLWSRIVASPTPLPTSASAYRTLVDYTIASRQLGGYFTGPFERLAAAGHGPPIGARFDEHALSDLEELVGLLARIPDAVTAAAWTRLEGDPLATNGAGRSALIAAIQRAEQSEC